MLSQIKIPPQFDSEDDWDDLPEEIRKARLTQLGISTEALYWGEMNAEAQQKVYTAWRRWGASCE